MKPSTTRTELTSVGRATPIGERLRRYWHPVGLATDATDIPRKVRALGCADRNLLRPGHRPAGGRRDQRWLKNDYGANAVRYSLLSAAVTTTLGALMFVWAARTIRGDIKRAA